MMVYQSGGVALIAALIGSGRGGRHGPPAALNALQPNVGQPRPHGDAAAPMQPGLSAIGRGCERAVVTTYGELRRSGTPDPETLLVCTALYRIHHPEASPVEARRLVGAWVDHHFVSRNSGPAPSCACADDADF